ncbi:MAG: alpha/beta hydrolase, partial [Phycisphaerales bacterium]|nr:alpha/beta hydrolase [Phycisphaerales bacterium]
APPAPAPAGVPDEINAIALEIEPPIAADNAEGSAEDSDPPTPAEPRGVVVYLQGLAGVAYERPVIDAIRRRGFVSMSTEFPWARWQPMRLELGTPEAVFAAGQLVAKMSDDCLAEAAYAVDSAIEHLWRTRPELRGKPVILVGFSAGSLALPAVAAGLGDRVSAAVIVGSGSNIVRITQTSELTDAGMRVQLFGKPAEGTMAGFLAGEYLRHSTLDPFHAAGSLRDKPVLQIHASSDGIVPSELGDELYEQLARPERWTFRGGHRLLFLQLESHAEDIAQWVENALIARTRTGPATPNTPNPSPGNGGLLRPM